MGKRQFDSEYDIGDVVHDAVSKSQGKVEGVYFDRRGANYLIAFPATEAKAISSVYRYSEDLAPVIPEGENTAF